MLVEVQPEAELPYVARARASREGGGTEEGEARGPFGWLVSRSYKHESLVVAHRRREMTTLETKSLPICGALEKW